MEERINNIQVTGNNEGLVFDNLEEITNEFETIDKNILYNNNILSTSLKKINEATPNIDVVRKWYGAIDLESVNKSMVNVYNDLRKYIQTCGAAINSTNKNLSGTLKLIKLLAMIEKDLYSKIDNESIASVELREILKDWCRQNNIKDEEVNNLFEASFQRAYTLRDRIQNVRNELNNKIDQYLSDLNMVKDRFNDLDNFISGEKRKIIDISNQQSKQITDAYNSYYETLTSIQTATKSKSDALMLKIDETKAQINENKEDSLKQIESKTNEAINRIDAVVENHIYKLNDLAKSSENKYNEYKVELNGLINDFTKKENEILKSQKAELEKQIQAQKLEFENFVCETTSQNKKYMLISCFVSATLAAIISLGIAFAI